MMSVKKIKAETSTATSLPCQILDCHRGGVQQSPFKNEKNIDTDLPDILFCVRICNYSRAKIKSDMNSSISVWRVQQLL